MRYVDIDTRPSTVIASLIGGKEHGLSVTRQHRIGLPTADRQRSSDRLGLLPSVRALLRHHDASFAKQQHRATIDAHRCLVGIGRVESVHQSGL